MVNYQQEMIMNYSDRWLIYLELTSKATNITKQLIIYKVSYFFVQLTTEGPSSRF